jgi:thioredoxin reductase (NADPH)
VSTGDVSFLTAEETERLRRYGKLTWYSDGERLVETGKVGPGMIVVLFGLVAITEREGLGHATPIAEQVAGQFIAEVGQRRLSTESPKARLRR